ncbi:hypothetical protein [Faecalibaculum rodentium]|uniref:hypothetical protein n=1 Tax=Faecalibaculum rodentium TaxID=1702221 RepID=UPI0027298000|nr:hypothetical protein [Faecalibaculum rodentium]
MDSGWIKLHRKMTDWEWYTDVPTKTLFIHLLLTANSKPGKWRGIDVPAGAKITSREKLSKETGLSQQQVRTALNKLKSTNDVTKSATSTYTLIQVVNYEKYQLSNQVSNQPATNEQPSINQPATTNNKERMLERKNAYIAAAENPVLKFGKFGNIPLTQEQFNSFMERYPETGKETIDEVSRRIKAGEAPKITNFFAYLASIASKGGPGVQRRGGTHKKTGVYSGQLPEWYSDTGSQFASEQERQQMLAEVEKARAQFSLGEKGEK